MRSGPVWRSSGSRQHEHRARHVVAVLIMPGRSQRGAGAVNAFVGQAFSPHVGAVEAATNRPA